MIAVVAVLCIARVLTEPDRMTRRGALLFLAMCVIWGIPYLLIRVAVRELAPVTLVFFRTVVRRLLLAPVAAYRGELRPLLRHWRPLLAYTAVEVAIPWVLLARAETKLTSSLTGLLIAAVPLVGAVIVTLTGDRERLGGRRWLGLLVGIVGVAAIVGLDLGQTDVVALVEIGFVAVGYAVGPIILSRSMTDLPAYGVVAASLLLTAIVYAPFAAANWPDQVPRRTSLNRCSGWRSICTALAFLVFFALIAEVGPVRATVITYVNPAVAAVLGVTLLSEHLTRGMVIGFALVLAGCVLATGEPRNRSPNSEACADSGLVLVVTVLAAPLPAAARSSAKPIVGVVHTGSSGRISGTAQYFSYGVVLHNRSATKDAFGVKVRIRAR